MWATASHGPQNYPIWVIWAYGLAHMAPYEPCVQKHMGLPIHSKKRGVKISTQQRCHSDSTPQGVKVTPRSVKSVRKSVMCAKIVIAKQPIR